MNIGIDANNILFEKAGVGKYSLNLINNLIKIDRKNHYFLYFNFLRQRKQRIAQVNKLLLNPLPKNVKLRFLNFPARWQEFLFSTPFPAKKIINDDLDLFYASYPTGIPKNGFKKMITTVHDLAFLRFPEHRGKKLSNYYLKRHKIALKNCIKIIVPSKATKKDLQDMLDIDGKKITVIYEAADSRFKVIHDQRLISNISSKYFDPEIEYILSVGTLEPRKNLPRLIEAYSQLPNKLTQKYKLVLVGASGWNNNLLTKTIENLNLKDKVIITGFASDDDLAYIYNKASIFIYPSLYEGFGLPPLEAMSCGLPVITSNVSSLPEVVGNAAILINPNNEDEIMQAAKKLLLDQKVKDKLIKKGLVQAKKFSWQKTAEQTLSVFTSEN